MQIRISSMGVRNPPTLLPPGSVCLPSICPDCRCRSQSLPGVSRKQRYHTRLSCGKSCANRGAARPYWKPRAKGMVPFGYPVIFSQMVLTQKNCIFPCPTIFSKCHSTCSLFLLEHCKNFKLCRDVTSKNSVFSHIGILSPHCCGRDGNASK